MSADRLAALERLRGDLAAIGIGQALLSNPESLAALVGYEHPAEDWPVSDPFTASPPLLLVGAEGATLLVPAAYRAHVAGVACEVLVTASHISRGLPPDSFAALEEGLAAAKPAAGPIGVERSLPYVVGQMLERLGCEPRRVDEEIVRSRAIKLPRELEAMRRAASLADLVQATVKAEARPGISEVMLAELAHAAVCDEVGHRVPSLVTIQAGTASAEGFYLPGDRVVEAGDVVLVDAGPWVGGVWGDSANAIVVGTPTAEHRRMFDAIRRALEIGIDACRPGAIAGEVDTTVRQALADWGPAVYYHHTGHGLGWAWSEPPLLVPGSEHRIEAGMVLAVEPALYVRGVGGIRLEHTFRVGPDGNEILTRFEHTL
jgi:Xaa-Pro aminopeptidase